eukprot:s2668_g3.t1
MPPKGFIDGPTCSDASAVAKAWAALARVQERTRVLKHLVVAKGGTEDPDGKTVLPSRENMIHNAEILEALALNMNQRGRVGADPIDVICCMTVKFYEMHPVYTEVKKDFNLKAVSYNNAWVLHKMVSRLRSSLPKYQADCLSKAPRLATFQQNVKYCPDQDAGLQPPQPTAESLDLDYSPLEALLNEAGDDGEVPSVPCESDPPSSADTPVEADAVPTFDRELEGAHPSTGGLARAKSTDDMDTLQFLIDTQAGVDCAMELPLTQPMWHDFLDDAPPVLHRTSADMKNQDKHEDSELADPEPAQPDPAELHDVKRHAFDDMLAHAALPKNPNLLKEWDTIVIGDSDIEDATSSAGHPVRSKQEELATYSDLLAKMETKLGQLTGKAKSRSEDHVLFGGSAGSPDASAPAAAGGTMAELPELEEPDDSALSKDIAMNPLPDSCIPDPPLEPGVPMAESNQGTEEAPVTKDEQWKLTAAAKAKSKAEKTGGANGDGKPKRKARAKGKAKGTAKAKAKAVAKAKAKSRAAAKAKGTRKAKAKAVPRAAATGKIPPPTIDDVLRPLPPGVPEALGFPPAPPSPPKTPSASCASPPGPENENIQPAMKRPAAKTASRSKKPKTESGGDAALADASSSTVKELERKGLVPNTFGGRGKPSGGWALEKYARTTAAFKENIEPKLEPRTKNKAQAWRADGAANRDDDDVGEAGAQPAIPEDEPLFFLESFAGQAQATRSVQSSFPEKVTAAIDVKFSEKHYTPQFGNKIATLLDRLKPRTDYVGDNPRVDAVALFDTWSWGDMRDDARMRCLIRYLYGAKALQIPPAWKSVLPREI